MAQAPVWEMTQGLDLRIEIHALRFLFWRNRVHGEMDTSQFRLIGWEFEAGIRLGPVELYRHHHSQHILESQHPWMRFPVEDAYGVRIHLITSP